jgi:hypothetical protein
MWHILSVGHSIIFWHVYFMLQPRVVVLHDSPARRQLKRPSPRWRRQRQRGHLLYELQEAARRGRKISLLRTVGK